MNESVISEIRQYLTFKLGDEVFGVDVAQVREILDYIKITKVPQTPDYMCGVNQFTGECCSCIDMRLKFGLERTNTTVDTCIVVVEVELEGEKTILGALVDSVQEVFEIDPEDIEPAPRIGIKLNIDFIKGMGKRDDNFIILLNIDKIFTSEELSVIEKTKNQSIN